MIELLNVAFFQRLSNSETVGIITAAIVAIVVRFAFGTYKGKHINKLPLVNGRKWWQWRAKEQKLKFCTEAKKIIDDGFANVSFITGC